MDTGIHSLDDRQRFRQVVRARAPQAFYERVKEAAHSEGVAISEFVRRALQQRIAAVGEV